MLFSVVFCVDAGPADLPKLRRSLRKALGVTRAESEYRYIADDDPDHSFYRAESLGGSGLLTRAQFAALLEDLGNPGAEESDTMGTLGGPLGWGCVPDVNFHDDSPEWILCLRVTPIARRGNGARDAEHAQRIWERLRNAFITRYEGGYDRGRRTWGKEYTAAVRKERAELRAFNA